MRKTIDWVKKPQSDIYTFQDDYTHNMFRWYLHLEKRKERLKDIMEYSFNKLGFYKEYVDKHSEDFIVSGTPETLLIVEDGTGNIKKKLFTITCKRSSIDNRLKIKEIWEVNYD